MRKYGYDGKFAAGAVAAGGTLDILIPQHGIRSVFSSHRRFTGQDDFSRNIPGHTWPQRT
jgi:hypothetical protein